MTTEAERIAAGMTKRRLVGNYLALRAATERLIASHRDLIASARRADGTTPDLAWSEEIEAGAVFTLRAQENRDEG